MEIGQDLVDPVLHHALGTVERQGEDGPGRRRKILIRQIDGQSLDHSADCGAFFW